MKKTILLGLNALFLVGCISGVFNVERYLDDSKYQNEKMSISIKSLSCSSTSDNYQVSLYITIENLMTKTQKFKLSDYAFVRQSSNYAYKAGSLSLIFSNETELEPGLSETLNFLTDIPSDIREEKYDFTIKVNSVKYSLHLYNLDGSFYTGFGYF